MATPKAFGVALHSFRRREDQPRPTGEETEAAEGSDRAEPVPRLRDQRHQIETSAEKDNPGKEQPPRAAIDRAGKRENEQRDRVNEMIKNRFVPDIQHATQFESRFQTVRSERSQRYCQKTERGCNPKHCHVERSRDIS